MVDLKVESLNIYSYLFDLLTLVNNEKYRFGLNVPKENKVTCVLEHSLTFTSEGPIEKAQLKYGTITYSKGKMLPPSYEVKDLTDGEDYNFGVITDLIQAAAADCNLAIDMFAMNADVMYSDDITGKIQNFIFDNLRGSGVETGYNVSTIAVSGGISKITIMVG